MSAKSLRLIGLIIAIAFYGLIFASALHAYGCAASGGGGGAPDANPVGNDDGEFPADLPEPEGELPVGRSSQTLEAAEEKTFRLPVERGETLIVSTNLPDSTTNVDMYAYAPNREQPIASSNNGPGEPDDLMFVAAETGTYIIEVVNISASEKAQLSLNVRRIPPRSSSATVLNGIYAVTERDGIPVSTSDEGWVFSDGELASMYGSFAATQFQGAWTVGAPDWRYWLEARAGAETSLSFEDVSLTLQIVDIQPEQGGLSLTVSIDYLITVTSTLEPTVGQVEQAYRFEGAIIEDERAIRGDFTVISTATADAAEPATLEESGAMKLEKDAGDVVVVAPAPPDTGDGAQTDVLLGGAEASDEGSDGRMGGGGDAGVPDQGDDDFGGGGADSGGGGAGAG